MSDQKILIATDVPYWQTSTGAEQRIASLHRFLVSSGYEVKVFYLGVISDAEQLLVDKYGFDVIQNTSDQPPEKLMSRIRWYADATLNQARSWLNRENNLEQDQTGPASLTLADFDWPWARTRFQETIEQYRPDAVIFEYIKTAYLLDSMNAEQRKSTCCLLDTHDVLFRRAEQFFANGFPHWLKIDREEECRVLDQFDVVMAIQDKEAELFRSMASQPETITVGHAVESQDIADFDPEGAHVEPQKITIGYIGSKNFSNWQAIRNFLNRAWPAVSEVNGDVCELVVAGAICDWFDDDDWFNNGPAAKSNDRESEPSSGDSLAGSATQMLTRNNVRFLGRIDDVMQFYDQVDVVINPVEFGTGLKIKNAESLRYGKLLITTRNGFDGMPEATRLACQVVEDVEEMGMAINSVCKDLSQIRPMQSLALQLAQTEFSESQAYSELKRELERRIRRRIR